MGVGRRIAELYEVKVNALLDRAEDPGRSSTTPMPGSRGYSCGSAVPLLTWRPPSTVPHNGHTSELVAAPVAADQLAAPAARLPPA